MKQLFLLCIGCLLMTGLYAQTPQGINYQAVARNGDGVLLQDQNVDVTFTIRPATGGNAAYVEGHSLMTNAFGLFTAVIGEGSATTGTFNELDWSQAYELGISVNGTDLGFTPFQSVPYALNVAPRRELIGVPAAVFTTNNEVASFRNSIGSGGVEITSTNGASITSVLNAPVQLPHGAMVESMTVYFTDNSEAELRIWLAKEFYSSGFTIVGEVRTTGNEAGAREETVTINQTINNENGGYYIRVFCDDWNLPGTKRIKGVKIAYTH
jgi:hypothetical protein